MKVTLPNGITLEGTIDQINAVRKTFGYAELFVADGVHYKSQSKGIIRIADMNDMHIKNAIRKIWASAISNIDTNLSNKEFLATLNKPATDLTLIGLVAELMSRR